MENYDDLYTGRKRGVFNVRLLSHVIINGISELYCLYCFFFFFVLSHSMVDILCYVFYRSPENCNQKKKNKIVGKNNRNENSNQGPIQPIVFH